jgi:hypothetical protein
MCANITASCCVPVARGHVLPCVSKPVPFEVTSEPTCMTVFMTHNHAVEYPVEFLL